MQRDRLTGFSVHELARISAGNRRHLLEHLELAEPDLGDEFLLALLDGCSHFRLAQELARN